MNIGFIKYMRTKKGENLHEKPIENHVLSIIAIRVSREGNPVKGVRVGESIISDYKGFGLSRQQLRTAISNLQKWGYITTRATNKGSYATLIDTSVYDCNIAEPTNKDASNQPPTTQTANHNQEVKNKEVKNKEKKEVDSSESTTQPLPYKKEFLQVFEAFKSITGKNIRVGKTDSKIKSSDKYKKIKARLEGGATVEEMIKIIEYKNKQWRNDNYMKQYIEISTLFGFANFEKYLDQLESTAPISNESHPEAPTDTKERFKYFRNLFLKYAPHLEKRLVNTEYKDRIYQKKDAEGLIRDLERQNPQLLEL